MGITEIDRHASLDGEVGVIGHLLSLSHVTLRFSSLGKVEMALGTAISTLFAEWSSGSATTTPVG